MSWFWRTKPRSIIKTIQWFPNFAALKGKNWEEKASYESRIHKPVHPARRAYIYSAHSDEDNWLSSISFEEYLGAAKDTKETESNGRNDKATFEFFGFGYVDDDGTICVTDVGSKIVQGTFDSEDYLKQLLKLRLPKLKFNLKSETKGIGSGEGVFPFQLVLSAFQRFESLNRSELALLFGCMKESQLPDALDAIERFKKEYAKLGKKNDTARVRQLCKDIYIETYGPTLNDIKSYYDYAEALSRTLVYTGLFSLSGRSIASKVRVAEHSAAKVDMLQEKYTFYMPESFKNISEYMDWYGSASNVQLPWENAGERKSLIAGKAELLIAKLAETGEEYQKEAELSIEEVNRLVEEANQNSRADQLKIYENKISQALINHNEERFKKVTSKTKEGRKEILDRYGDILDNDDMSALWLEVNTWKSLIAIPGNHTVKRNFKIEDDLTPRSFAPGVGNTPDMEVYGEDFVLIPEVSLMTGVRQWEHEGSSVIDHVLDFVKRHEERKVTGLFLSSRLNVRTVWQFFVLNRESWVGAPVPVVPLTIKQYVGVIRFIYDNALCIHDFMELLQRISDLAFRCSDYLEWQDGMDQVILLWKKEKASAA